MHSSFLASESAGTKNVQSRVGIDSLVWFHLFKQKKPAKTFVQKKTNQRKFLQEKNQLCRPLVARV